MINYLTIINIIAFILCFFDKRLAQKRKTRISEKILLLLCILGGVFGFLIASRIFHHKTKDLKFKIFMYPTLFIWIIILFYLILC